MNARSAPPRAQIEGADGLLLNVLTWSSGGPPLLFVHGFGLDAHVWDDVACQFVNDYRVLALDLRGHGDSQHDPEYRYHHASIGRDIVSVMRNMAIDRVTLVAHSTAGHAAIGVAARFPNMIEALVLLEAGPELPKTGAGGRQNPAARRTHFDTPEQFEAVLVEQHPGASRASLAALAAHGLRPDPGGGYTRKLDPAFYRPKTSRDPANRRNLDRASWAARGEVALWRDLAGVRCRSLVLRGENSRRFSRETVERMTNEVMPDARAVEIPGAGHNIMLDRPARLTRALAEFLTGTS